jgi:hypothetical protein
LTWKGLRGNACGRATSSPASASDWLNRFLCDALVVLSGALATSSLVAWLNSSFDCVMAHILRQNVDPAPILVASAPLGVGFQGEARRSSSRMAFGAPARSSSLQSSLTS